MQVPSQNYPKKSVEDKHEDIGQSFRDSMLQNVLTEDSLILPLAVKLTMGRELFQLLFLFQSCLHYQFQWKV